MLYKASKLLYILFIFYIGIFSKLFFIIPGMTQTLGLGMIIFFILSKFTKREEIYFTIPKPIQILIFFTLYIAITGYFVSHDKVHLINSVITYTQMIIMMFYIINISKIEKDNKFFLISFFIYSIVYMFIMIFWGVETGGGRLRLSINSNPNGDALTLFYGVFCSLMIFNFDKLSRFIIHLILIALLTYTIILTGSRKSFLAVILLIFLWFTINFRKYWKRYSIYKKVVSGLIILIILIIVVTTFIPLFLESSFYQRALERGYSISDDQVRSGMYKEAMYFFSNNPLLGIGFNQYRLLSIYNTYSHSTYAEVLSTTGIIGTVIYFSAYLVIIYNLIYIYKKTKRTITSSKALSYLMLMFIMLILGTGVIHFYEIYDNIMLALMISFYYTENLNKLNKTISD